MFFKNLAAFTFPSSVSIDEQALAQLPLKPVGQLELVSSGFVAPAWPGGERAYHDQRQLIEGVGACAWIAIGVEERVLPTAVLNSELQKRLDKIERAEGRVPGGRARKRIKEDLVHELLPRAFVKPTRVNVMIDHKAQLCFVDTSSRVVAEMAVSHIRSALGSFPALPLNAEVAPRAVLTGWIAGDPLPDGLALGDECTLKSGDNSGPSVRCTNMDLLSDEVGEHLQAGLQVARLGLVFNDRVSFVLGEDLVVRKLKFLDGCIDELEQTEREDIHAELMARFALMSGETRALYDVLSAALKITKGE